MNHKDPTCKCARCAAIAAGATPEEADKQQVDWTREKMKKHGWIVHFVPDDEQSPTGTNIHTHGLQENFGHPDFQLIVPLPQKMAHNILINLADRVKAGEVFTDGQVVTGVIRGFEVKMVTATETGRVVLRVVIPAKDGKLDREEMSEPWVKQYADLEGGASK